MRPRPRALLSLLLAVLASGCVLKSLHDRADASLQGTADGYTPMSSSLVVYVTDDRHEVRQSTFDRDEWYLAGLQAELDARLPVIFQGTREGVTGRLQVHHVALPGNLDEYKWSNRPEPRAHHAQMDAQWDARLRELGGEGTRIRLSHPAGLDSVP